MKKSNTSLGESLVFEGLLTQEQFSKAQTEAKQSRDPFPKVLKRLQLIDEKRLMKFMSAKFRIPEVELTHQIIKPQILKLIPELLVRKLGVMPVRKIGKRLTVALSDPLNLNVLDRLRLESGFDIDPALATDSEIRNAIDQYYGAKSEMSDVVQTLTAPDEVLKEKFDGGEGIKAEEAPVMKLVNTMIAEAVKQGASDIHIAPDKHDVLVRYRVDGVLREADRYPKASHNSIVSRMKVMTNLDISESRIPQDGRVQINKNGEQVDLRVSIVPTIQGENIVIRLLNLGTAVRTLEGLGMSYVDLEVFQNLIEQHQWMHLSHSQFLRK